ncbi:MULTISPECIES: TetR/AcrR family transcriptional regulator [Isoptericola]|uniref:TetR/AcrR family transcriptional regulator n=1 Tax=Isoptericola sediminis TaxID=2733572 RepID=A0A849K376_9MICO|nr:MULTISPECIES: TetR/AcrR family transcriptional regulator [Isoptericola]MDO8145459.1 TetR/AcrR family transcriptional regulator [Isoptericola sp. 178]MDO8149100.1 TetR/AcrR family transcriptional regulator [Isoptericola sp. b515]MDO8150960.1 TetR/AcrR family transcriptional regulator [Isoptericola sp. b408]NNU27718.1 TetR/AcrR family transcriptional regulator [Isoptericola sediminis]
MGSDGPLSRDRVLGAGVALADADGLAAVTMRGVATRLGVEAMSLYHYLPGKKDELLDGLVDVVAAQIHAGLAEREDPGDDWVADVRSRCLVARDVVVRHPWLPRLLGSRPNLRPGVYQLYDEALGAMVRGGCSYRLAHRAMHALGGMVLGFTPEVFDPQAGDDDVAEEELAAMAESLPHLTAMVAAELHDPADPTLGWCDSQTEFEFTLGLLLDGIERARRDGV